MESKTRRNKLHTGLASVWDEEYGVVLDSIEKDLNNWGCVSVSVKRKYVDSTIKLVNAMTLECAYPKTAIISQMSWIKEKDNDKEKIAVFKIPYQLHVESRYKFKVHVSNTTLSNKSLVFSNATEEDTGFYLCSFQTFPHGLWEKRIEVVQS
ncbi:hypothetical protein EYD10_08639, partial [Varanus komodoensis]